MSDFLFSSRRSSDGHLAGSLKRIGPGKGSKATEYHGPWGSLAITPSRYPGFAPVEAERHLCVVIGGPVLRFRDNAFLTGAVPEAGTRAILERWTEGRMVWEEDLSGPFVALFADRHSGEVTWVTDLLMSLPVYEHRAGEVFTVGTHVDAVARAAGEGGRFDDASLADFVLHFAVTYPHTAYEGTRQCRPATIHQLAGNAEAGRERARSFREYWRPEELRGFRRLDDAADALLGAVSGEIQRIAAGMGRAAHFLSGGEDSRVIAGLLPAHLERDALVFLDEMNREGVLARRVARALGSRFVPCFREPLHYLDILPEAAALIGSGHQYLHAHALGIHQAHGLGGYPAVFGGYAADSLFKGTYSRKSFLALRHGFVPEIPLEGETRSRPVQSELFPESILEQITDRRRAHLARVQELRPESAHEWFGLWPLTMRVAVPNIWANRRLFRSYEPFLAADAVKVGASVPISWKLNRRLFRAAFRTALARTRWIPHADGRFPYFPWWVNTPVQFGVQLTRKVAKRLGGEGPHQGPWNDWESDYRSEEWQAAVQRLSNDGARSRTIQHALEKGAFTGRALNVYQKATLAQVCHQLREGSEL